MKFKAEEFLRDIGLNAHTGLLEKTVKISNNIVKLPVTNISHDIAIIRHVDNLVATYGTEAVHDILKKLTDE